MKHFRNILLLASFLGFALVAFGSEISSETAEDTVKGWLRLDRAPLGEPLGNQIKNVETFRDNASNILYHVVYLKPSGFVIVSGDDLVEPIIAFASRGRFDPSLNNPLGALVNRDVPNRVAHARAMRTTAITGHFLNAKKKWQKLKQDFLQQGPQGPVPADFNGISTISDIRVAPFLQTLWNQQTANNGLACYNYYTPPYAAGTSSNYPCGCVATALSQTLYYFQYPTVGVGALSFSITVDGTSRAASLRGGDGLGGPYIWGNMPVNPNNPTAIQCQAIGALTFDAGVAIGMDYEASGSAASVQNAGNALVNTFGYSNAKYYYGYDLTNVVNPNLDAHLPVIFAIYVGNVFGVGHCVVCDGYGYNYGTLYHHINMGWGGYDNAWFALPDINASYDFVTGRIKRDHPGSKQVPFGDSKSPTRGFRLVFGHHCS